MLTILIFVSQNMKQTIVRIIIIFLLVSFFWIFSTWKPTIYKEIEHNKTQLLASIDNLGKTTRGERIIALSDSMLSDLMRKLSDKFNTIHYDYYYVLDFWIDYYQKDRMLAVMTLNEWYEFKQDINNWKILAWWSVSISPYVSQGYMIEELERIRIEILKL